MLSKSLAQKSRLFLFFSFIAYKTDLCIQLGMYMYYILLPMYHPWRGNTAYRPNKGGGTS